LVQFVESKKRTRGDTARPDLPDFYDFFVIDWLGSVRDIDIFPDSKQALFINGTGGIDHCPNIHEANSYSAFWDSSLVTYDERPVWRSTKIRLYDNRTKFITYNLDNTIRVYEIKSCRQCKELRGHTYKVDRVIIFGHGSLALSFCSKSAVDNSLILWDLSKAQERKEEKLKKTDGQKNDIFSMRKKKPVAENIPPPKSHPAVLCRFKGHVSIADVKILNAGQNAVSYGVNDSTVIFYDLTKREKVLVLHIGSELGISFFRCLQGATEDKKIKQYRVVLTTSANRLAVMDVSLQDPSQK